MADTTASEWFAFDANASLEIGIALGASVGTLSLTDVNFVGIHQQLISTTLQNWHGAFVDGCSVAAVPGPSTFALFGLGAVALLMVRKRSRL